MKIALLRSTPLNLIVASVLVFAACRADAQEAKKADAKPPQSSASPTEAGSQVGDGLPPLPTGVDWNDEAFNRYVNLSLLDEAFTLRKSKLLTDVALQFVEGERVLQRSHQAISAKKLLLIATKLAAQKQDQESLERIARSAKSRGDKQLEVMVAAAVKFSGESRAAVPAVMVNPGVISAAAISDYQGFVEAITTASLIGGKSSLEQIEGELSASDLPDDLRAAASKKLKAAMKAQPKDDAAAEALASLSGVSRQIRFSGNFGGVRVGVGPRGVAVNTPRGRLIPLGRGQSARPGISFSFGGRPTTPPANFNFGGGTGSAFGQPTTPPPARRAVTRMALTSRTIREGRPISLRHAAEPRGAANLSPALSWAGAPAGTVSYALLCEDPDAPRGPFAHWVLFNLPANYPGLREGVSPRLQSGVRGGFTQGTNDFGETGYTGPAPPPGETHRYYFTLYALDTTLNLDNTATANDVLRAIGGRELARGQLMGTYRQ